MTLSNFAALNLEKLKILLNEKKSSKRITQPLRLTNMFYFMQKYQKQYSYSADKSILKEEKLPLKTSVPRIDL